MDTILKLKNIMQEDTKFHFDFLSFKQYKYENCDNIKDDGVKNLCYIFFIQDEVS